ncbi:MAG: hypothetical protein AB7T06_18390 [Kofleriaceae bacterium]
MEAEGFSVVNAPSASEATREIWGGNFLCVIISTLLTGTTHTALQAQLRQMAPEIETIAWAKNDEVKALVRKAIELRDGSIATFGAA